jgi:hypothetical protein
MLSSTFSIPTLWAALACAAVALAVIIEKKADLAKFIREPGIKSLSYVARPDIGQTLLQGIARG